MRATEKHRGLMIQWSRRVWVRLRQAGAPTEFSEIMQEASIAVLCAELKFDPERGFAESTYFTSAIRNHLNHWADKLIQSTHWEMDELVETSEGALSIYDVTPGKERTDQQVEREHRVQAITARLSKTAKVMFNLFIHQPDEIDDALEERGNRGCPLSLIGQFMIEQGHRSAEVRRARAEILKVCNNEV